jgi:LysM repeat protein
VAMNWINRQPMKNWALGLSAMGVAACSSTQPAHDPSDMGALFEDVAPVYLEEQTQEALGDTYTAEPYETEVPFLGATGAPHKSYSGMTPYRQSRFPEIANRAFQKGGYWLNGYVFVRGERSWEDLSRLLYGRADRAALLAEWNSNAPLQSGAVIYYNSPFRPDDTQTLKSFDADFGMTLSSVSVSAGDSLSLIALSLYGHVDGWKELASLNADLLSSPDLIEVGQTLRIASERRDTSPILQAYVQSVQEQAQAALNTVDPVQSVQEEQNMQAMSEPQAFDAEGSQAPPALANAEEGLPLTEIAIMLLSLLGVAGLVTLIMRRRKKLEESHAANTAFFVKKKTGTED